MTHEDLKKRWAEANERVELLDKQRYRLVEHTQQEWLEAQTEFQDSVEECLKADALICEACAAPIFPGDRYHVGPSPLCFECAPTYQSLIHEPDIFVDRIDQNPSNPGELRAAYDAHITAGGSPDDKMVEVYD